MGSPILPQIRSGEMKLLNAVFLSLLASECLSQRPTDGSYTDKPGKPTKPGDDEYMDKPDKEDWMKEGCCPLKAVESATDESKNEMFALVEEVPWSQAKKENCSSNCAYVKMKELRMVMEEMKEMMNMTDMDMDKSTPAPSRMEESEKSEDMTMMYMLLGKEKMMEMKVKMMINRLQKYCFTPTEKDMQSMCAAPDMDMNVIDMIFDMANGDNEEATPPLFFRITSDLPNLTTRVRITYANPIPPECSPLTISVPPNMFRRYPDTQSLCGNITVTGTTTGGTGIGNCISYGPPPQVQKDLRIIDPPAPCAIV